MKSADIRQKFFDFFTKHGHILVPSSSLIPAQDPTLLFANAGMNQFKDVFLGKERRLYKRAVSIQKCMRAGGKHNDLENVGFTRRHLTFFEMMGNFSFGDYFKKDAILFAWNFLTKGLGMNQESFYASVYEKDDEAYRLWQTVVGLAPHKIIRLGAQDNFWQMGETGPCGPCSEIYVDQGTHVGCKSKNCAPGCSCDRFLEIWNLVFMQFDRQVDGTDKPLSQTGVDTGMGLERLCTILQNKESVFETDLFMPLILATEQLTGKKYSNSSVEIKAAFRVVADHIRSTTFAIADGGIPSNEGRGYVIRKIIRRAALLAQKLSNKNFFPELAHTVIQNMGHIYPELLNQEKFIVSTLMSETEKFSHNLSSGQSILQKYMAEATDKIIKGEQAFKLYDTYGFPLELTKVIGHESGFTVDIAGFEHEMEKQRKQSGKKERDETVELPDNISTEFTGYSELETKTTISALLCNDCSVETVPAGESCWIVTPRSPFYVECGGQVSDQGWVMIDGHQATSKGLKKINNAIAVNIIAPVELRVNDSLTLMVDKQARLNTMKNHTATHLLQSALMQVLGKGVKQAGSLVAPDYLRFDFTYHETPTPEQLKHIETIINNVIMENIPLKISQTTYQDALKRGVIAFFGDKYNPDKVRVVEVPNISAELCGGTHVNATGDIGSFKITEISALSAGNKRIVAITGPKAVELLQKDFDIVKTACQEYKVKPEQLLTALEKQKEQLKTAQIQLKNLQKECARLSYPQWLIQQETIQDIPFLFLTVPHADIGQLREHAQALNVLKKGIYFLTSSTEKNIVFLIFIDPIFENRLNFSELYNFLRNHHFLGGLSKNIIQGGISHIPEDFEDTLKEWIKKTITL